MGINEGAEVVKQLGLTAFVIIVILGMFGFVLKKIFDDHKEDRNSWNKMADTHFVNQVKASQYQRNEHVKILKCLTQVLLQLTTINGKDKKISPP